MSKKPIINKLQFHSNWKKWLKIKLYQYKSIIIEHLMHAITLSVNSQAQFDIEIKDCHTI